MNLKPLLTPIIMMFIITAPLYISSCANYDLCKITTSIYPVKQMDNSSGLYFSGNKYYNEGTQKQFLHFMVEYDGYVIAKDVELEDVRFEVNDDYKIPIVYATFYDYCVHRKHTTESPWNPEEYAPHNILYTITCSSEVLPTIINPIDVSK
jgi:hypothetical protein